MIKRVRIFVMVLYFANFQKNFQKMKKLLLFFFLISQVLLAQNSPFDQVGFKNIGPTIMSGRVVDLAVNPENPTEFYVAYASGGLWHTMNNGTSFSPIMDSATTLNCGSVTVDWNSGTIWVGTGEVNSSRSSYSGIGILKSSDNGKTWENIGLPDSHHIGRICVNPKNNNEIVVGVIGHLYSKNKERGVYKTLDGGKTWKHSLFVNDETGIIDLVIAPTNFRIQYAAAWQRDRKAWDFKGNGTGSGIYKSTDSGETWELMTSAASGFPTGDKVGRIGLSTFNAENLYAVVDNQNQRPSTKTEKPKDANSALFETNVIGCEVYKSVDGGKTWSKKNKDYIDDMYNTYGYYFGNIAVDSRNENRLYIGGVPLLFSEDGGSSFSAISKENVHADHHVTWVNPKNPNHIINGNDGGVNITYDNGEHWVKCNNEAVGQFYSVNVDYKDDYNVYGGLQDNGVWVGPNNYSHSTAWQQEGKYPFEELIGGDGMQVQIDSRNPDIVFTGFQFGNYYKINRKTDTSNPITPSVKKGEKPFRFNWQTPILLSSHNQDILYMGSNFLHRSMNQGKSWEIISPDLTNGAVEGNVAFGTITSISESKLKFGLLYVGSDDGKIHVSKDGGTSWQLISESLPQNLWVSRVVASSHAKGRVYATLNGYRSDDFKSYAYVSDDFGTTWKSIADFPNSPVNVILEDNKNEKLLFVGTDNNLFASMDKGITWQDFSNGMPNVAVHDLVIQTKASELIVGTHGRSIYKVDVSKMQALNDSILAKPLHLYKIANQKKSDNWGKKNYAWGKVSEPSTDIWFYSISDKEVVLTIENDKKAIVFTQKVAAKKGMNKVNYDYSISKTDAENWNKKDKNIKIKEAENKKYYLPVSKYTVDIQNELSKETATFEIIDNKKITRDEK
jgi:photosystem II stability/assembly factor-like uncharacterized protein